MLIKKVQECAAASSGYFAAAEPVSTDESRATGAAHTQVCEVQQLLVPMAAIKVRRGRQDAID